MGKTKQQIIDSVLEKASAFHLNDDFPVDRDWLSDIIDDIREKMLNDYQLRFGYIEEAFYELDCCVSIDCATLAQCVVDGITFEDGKVWKMDLSQYILTLGWDSIKSVFVMNEDEPDNFANKQATRKSLMAFNTTDGLRHTKNNLFWTLIGGSGYLKNLNSKGQRKICIIGLKRKPGSACDETVSTDLYPVYDLHRLEFLAVQVIAQSMGMPTDRLNDAADIPQSGQSARQQQSSDTDG
jgi:hypothetical protein